MSHPCAKALPPTKVSALLLSGFVQTQLTVHLSGCQMSDQARTPREVLAAAQGVTEFACAILAFRTTVKAQT